MSDFRISLSLGNLRYYAEKDAKKHAGSERRSSGYFYCRGHHQDPVFDYNGMPGAYPIMITFPYLAYGSAGSDTMDKSTRSISQIIFGSQE